MQLTEEQRLKRNEYSRAYYAVRRDHIVALSKDGNHKSSNLCASCEFCNCSKCDRSLADWVPPTNQHMLNI